MNGQYWISDDEGDDTHAGTEKRDVFVFDRCPGDDTITGFSRGHDLINLQNFYDQVTTFDGLTITDNGTDSVIDLTAHGGGTITLKGVTGLDAGDFSFALAGTDGANTLTAGDSHDFIYGYGGNDTIRAGGGNDYIAAGAGNDTVYAGAGDDIVYEDEGGNDTIYGGAGNEKVYGGAGDDTIYGGEGNDYLSGEAGNDTIYGDAGDDVVYGRSGDDALYGGEGSDTLGGDAGDDTLTGGAGNDYLHGGGGADTFVFEAGHGSDKIQDFKSGQDVIDLSAFTGIGGIDDLNISIRNGRTTIDLSDQGGGTVTIGNSDSLNDIDADDFVFYQSVYTGTAAADTLVAGAGDDTVTGLGGDDTLTGSAGADAFVFGTGHGNDTVTDFSDSDGDTIDLSAFTGITEISQLTTRQDGDNVVLDLTGQTGGGTITLEDFDLADLAASHFTFYEMPPDGG